MPFFYQESGRITTLRGFTSGLSLPSYGLPHPAYDKAAAQCGYRMRDFSMQTFYSEKTSKPKILITFGNIISYKP